MEGAGSVIFLPPLYQLHVSMFFKPLVVLTAMRTTEIWCSVKKNTIRFVMFQYACFCLAGSEFVKLLKGGEEVDKLSEYVCG
jgi:hypothetical protein